MIDDMQNGNPWPLADWIALTVRWAFTAGASLWFAYYNRLDLKALILILGMLIVKSGSLSSHCGKPDYDRVACPLPAG